MKIPLLLTTFLFCALSGFSQNSNFQIETFWIRHGNEDREILDSTFPQVKSSKHPAAAELINTALQMESLGGLLTPKRKAELLDTSNLSQSPKIFSVIANTNRMLSIDIGEFFRTNSMSMNGHYEYTRYYFDAVTGQRLDLSVLFTSEGFSQVSNTITPLFQKQAIDIIATLMGGIKTALNSDEGKGCIDEIRDAFCNRKVRMSFNDHEFTFSMDDCDWSNPRSYQTYTINEPREGIEKLLSPIGKQLLTNSYLTTPDTSPYYQVWKGSIGGKIPVTLMIKPTCEPDRIVGSEVYDKFGTTIPLEGSLTKSALKLGEIAPDGKTVATYSGTLLNGKFAGTWTKTDGSKTLPFEFTLPVPAVGH